DGIRDFHVTGVQTCALPISWRNSESAALGNAGISTPGIWLAAATALLIASTAKSPRAAIAAVAACIALAIPSATVRPTTSTPARSEERRVGKEGRSWRESEE